MRLFINGGGSGLQTTLVNKKFKEVLNKDTRPLLYIPFAMTKFPLESCYEWIKEELKDVGLSSIYMVENVEKLEKLDLNNYCAIYIGGGNTYLLLSLLKSNNSFNMLLDYIKNDGIVYGGSAGAVILGNDIDTIKLMDKNEVLLEDTKGLNVINGFSIYPHYGNKSEEFESSAVKHLSKFNTKVFALPEEVTLYMENGKCEIIGDRPFSVFDCGKEIKFNSNLDRVTIFNNIKTDNELMDFMNENITYGWIDKNNYYHFNNLFNFRNNYKISSIEEILEKGVGTCIEQAKLIKYFFDKIGLNNRLFCHRSYEDKDNFDEVKMHCIVLFEYNDIWYHFEHSNQMKRGIHKYNSVDEALSSITSEFDKENDVRVLTEIDEIKDKLTYKDFNLYVNSFDEYRYEDLKKIN